MTTAEFIDKEIARGPDFLADWLQMNRTDFINGKLNDSIIHYQGLNEYANGGTTNVYNYVSHPPSYISSICSLVRQSLHRKEQTEISEQNELRNLRKIAFGQLGRIALERRDMLAKKYPNCR